MNIGVARYDNPGKSALASILPNTHMPPASFTGGVLTLDTPFGCDPAHPTMPKPDGCDKWRGFTDTGDGTMGSVDGQQHVAILARHIHPLLHRLILPSYAVLARVYLRYSWRSNLVVNCLMRANRTRTAV